jgi:2-phospho-L-lactate guanylyltransferase
MSTWAVVPVKAIGSAKQRLSSKLTGEQRCRLVRAMLDDVLAALRGARGLDGIAIVTSVPDLTPPDVRRIEDPGGDLNTAVGQAAQVLTAAGATAMLVVAADLPFAKPGEIETVLAAARAAGVVVVPDAARRGTNALLLPLPACIAPAFGVRSRGRHVAAAQRCGIEPAVLHLPGLAFDVDGPAQLDRLRSLTAGRPAYGFLHTATEAVR